VDPGKIPPGGGYLTCPTCGKRWRVYPEPVAVGPTEPQPPPPSEAPSEADETSVCCPSCGHQFRPLASPASRKSVLVVDDQEFFRNFAVDLLAERYRTQVAKSFDEALRKAIEIAPDLIVLDLGLDQGPDDGRRLLEHLGAKFPVIVMTGRADFDLFGEEWKILERLGARDLVIKSLRLGDELPAKVFNLIGA